jgi:hypothetical protein
MVSEIFSYKDLVPPSDLADNDHTAAPDTHQIAVTCLALHVLMFHCMHHSLPQGAATADHPDLQPLWWHTLLSLRLALPNPAAPLAAYSKHHTAASSSLSLLAVIHRPSGRLRHALHASASRRLCCHSPLARTNPLHSLHSLRHRWHASHVIDAAAVAAGCWRLAGAARAWWAHGWRHAWHHHIAHRAACNATQVVRMN